MQIVEYQLSTQFCMNIRGKIIHLTEVYMNFVVI